MKTLSTGNITNHWWAAALIMLVISGLGLGLARYAVQYSRRSAASQLAVLLRSDRPEVRQAAAEHLRQAGSEAIPPLVQALLDDREAVFQLASATIDRAMIDWQFLPADESAECVELLCWELDQTIAQLPAERRFVARRWAEQIAMRPGDGSANTTRILASCEAILRQSPVKTEVATAGRLATQPQLNPVAAAPAAVDLSTVEPNAYRPGTSEATSSVRLPPAEPPSLADHPAIVVEPRPAVTTDAAAPPEEPQRLVAPTAQPLPARSFNLTRQPEPRDRVQEPIDQVAVLKQQSDFEVMKKLHDPDSKLAGAADNELRRRGYRTVDLQICRALTDADPAVRRQLVEALPSMHSINSRPWLLQLSQDDDPEVRQAAESILRTSGQPTLERRLR